MEKDLAAGVVVATMGAGGLEEEAEITHPVRRIKKIKPQKKVAKVVAF